MWGSNSPSDEECLRTAQRVYQVCDGVHLLLTHHHLASLSQQLPQQRQPPPVHLRHCVPHIPTLEADSWSGPGVQIELLFQTHQVVTSDTSDILAHYSVFWPAPLPLWEGTLITSGRSLHTGTSASFWWKGASQQASCPPGSCGTTWVCPMSAWHKCSRF